MTVHCDVYVINSAADVATPFPRAMRYLPTALSRHGLQQLELAFPKRQDGELYSLLGRLL